MKGPGGSLLTPPCLGARQLPNYNMSTWPGASLEAGHFTRPGSLGAMEGTDQYGFRRADPSARRCSGIKSFAKCWPPTGGGAAAGAASLGQQCGAPLVDWP